jgi:hypothetical protein
VAGDDKFLILPPRAGERRTKSALGPICAANRPRSRLGPGRRAVLQIAAKKMQIDVEKIMDIDVNKLFPALMPAVVDIARFGAETIALAHENLALQGCRHQMCFYDRAGLPWTPDTAEAAIPSAPSSPPVLAGQATRVIASTGKMHFAAGLLA